MNGGQSKFNLLQKISMSLMGVLVFITFIASNLHAVLWQKSDWLVSTVLPAIVIDLTNEQRLDNEAQELHRSAILDAAAKLKAEDMAKNQYFAHFSPTGVSPWHWFDKAGYVYAHAGENLAIHFTDSDEVVEAWMNSPTHRQNIVDNKYTEIGVATVKGKFEGYDTVYVVQLFGTPAIAPVASTKPVVTENVAQAEVKPSLATKEEAVVVETAKEDLIATAPVTQKVALASKTETTPKADEVVEEDKTIIETEPTTEPVKPETNDLVVNNEPILEETAVNEPIAEAVAKVNDSVVLESSTITDSSGLAVANIFTPGVDKLESPVAAIATQPNNLLQIIYFVLASVVIILLSISIIVEAKHLRFAQASYGAIMLFLMGGLWFFHSLLTSGAVIV